MGQFLFLFTIGERSVNKPYSLFELVRVFINQNQVLMCDSFTHSLMQLRDVNYPSKYKNSLFARLRKINVIHTDNVYNIVEISRFRD